jgi:hypothetical protein
LERAREAAGAEAEWGRRKKNDFGVGGGGVPTSFCFLLDFCAFIAGGVYGAHLPVTFEAGFSGDRGSLFFLFDKSRETRSASSVCSVGLHGLNWILRRYTSTK